MNGTFIINWADPIANFVSVTFSTDAAGDSWSVPVNKSEPDSWQQAISNWYSANLAVAAVQVPSEPVALLLPPQNSAPAE